MDRTRVQEIIAAYGADVARWPADEREAAQALMARDAELRADFDRASALDSDILAWAKVAVSADDVAATAAADRALAALPAPRRWWPTAVAGGSIAAALMVAALVLPSERGTSDGVQVAQATPAAPVQTAQVAQDLQVWASVFTPTPEEESVI